MTTPKTTSTTTSQTPQIPKELQEAASKAAGAAIDGVKQKVSDAVNPVKTANNIIINIPVLGWAARAIPEEQRLAMINSAVLPLWKMVEPVVQPIVNSVSAMVPQGVKDMFTPSKAEAGTNTETAPPTNAATPTIAASKTTPQKTETTQPDITPSTTPTTPKSKDKKGLGH